MMLFGFAFIQAQTTDNLICRLKKDYRATNLHRQNENTLLKAGEQYPVLGTSGKMVVIKVGAKTYYVSTGSIEIYKTGEHKSGHMMVNDTIPTPVDSVGRYIL